MQFAEFIGQFQPGQKYLLAVSGGLDSVVMLDLMAQVSGLELVIAHFDHQIRGAESAGDAEFVQQLAKRYHLPVVVGYGGLGPDANEDQARQARYRFLKKVAQQKQAQLCLGHHQDDVLETIALNLQRGTGWQGLVVMGDATLLRPLLRFSKRQLLNYARRRQLVWREDSTNQQLKYRRNQVRARIGNGLSVEAQQMLIELYRNQTLLKKAIFQQCQQFYQPSGRYQRYFWIMLDQASAMELLKFIIRQDFNLSLTRPQLERAWLAIKTAKPQAIAEIGEGLALTFSRQEWWFKTEPLTSAQK